MNTELWTMTGVVLIKSLWWIIPMLGGIITMAIMEERGL